MRLLAALLAVALLAPACAKREDVDDGRVRIVAGLYPLAYVARALGGDRVRVTDLTPPGAEPHDVELAPSQVAAIERADVVLVVPGLQPAVEAAARDRDTLAMPVERNDPHSWLDPMLLRQFAFTLASRLGYDARPVAHVFDTLDVDFRNGLATCARRDVVTSHAAFGYLAKRYGLTQVGIAGIEPDADPPPSRLAEVARYVRERHVTTVFFETLVSPKVAQAVARESGARTAVLDPVESVTGTDDYDTVMRRNLAALRTALGCT